MKTRRYRKSLLHVCLLALLTLFSGVIAIGEQQVVSPLTMLALISFVCIFLPVGWWAACAIAGFYAAIYFLIPRVRGGTAESQVWEDVFYITTSVLVGFIVGLFFDSLRHTHPQSPEP